MPSSLEIIAIEFETLGVVDSYNVPPAPSMREEEIDALHVHKYRVMGHERLITSVELLFTCKEFKMLGLFFTRGLVMVFGYAYPAYECFKTVEKNKPDIEQLRFWCPYRL